jgi:hypothetical protein
MQFLLALMNHGTAYNVGQSPKTKDLISNMLYWSNKGDILKTFDRIAQSFTNQMRSGPQSYNRTGQVWRNELYMNVDWPWLAYPVALLVAVSTSLDSRP